MEREYYRARVDTQALNALSVSELRAIKKESMWRYEVLINMLREEGSNRITGIPREKLNEKAKRWWSFVEIVSDTIERKLSQYFWLEDKPEHKWHTYSRN